LVAKLGVVLEDADETASRLETLIKAHIVPAGKLESLMTEVNQLSAISVSSLRTAKGVTSAF
jgi:hypothetical protein